MSRPWSMRCLVVGVCININSCLCVGDAAAAANLFVGEGGEDRQP